MTEYTMNIFVKFRKWFSRKNFGDKIIICSYVVLKKTKKIGYGIDVLYIC